MFLNLWAQIFGNGEWALRFPSIVFSSLTIIVTYNLGKELFNKEVGFISSLLLIFLPLDVLYAGYAKMYALFWFLAAGSFLFFFRFLKDKRRSSFIFYITASVFCCYTMYTGFLFLITQSIIFCCCGEKARWRKWFIGQLIILSLCAPWLVFFLFYKPEHWDWNSLRSADELFDYSRFFLKSFLSIIGAIRETGDNSWVVSSAGRVIAFLYSFFIVGSCLDLFTISRNNKKERLLFLTNEHLLLMWLIITTGMYFIFDYFFVPADLGTRHLGFLQVPIVLLVGNKINKFSRLIKMLLVSVMVIISINSECLRVPEDGWRSTAEELTRRLGENDIVLSYTSVPIFKYYFKADTSRFFEISNQYYRHNLSDFMPEDKILTEKTLLKKGILTKNVHSIFVLYKRRAPRIELNGFVFDYKVENGSGNVGFLHFRRMIE